MGKLSLNGHQHNNKLLNNTKTSFVLHRYFYYLIFISPLRLRWMHQTMPLAYWSLNQVTQSHFFLRILVTLLEGTRRMKKNYMPFFTLKQWRHYILGKETVIFTDHKPLRFAQSQLKLKITRQLKWINYLQQFQLVIKYQKKNPMLHSIVSTDHPLLYCLQWWVCRVTIPLLVHNCIL